MKKNIISVVFRLDDFSAVSSTDIERSMIRLFREHCAAVTLGLIPFVCEHDIGDPSECMATIMEAPTCRAGG
jgi:hypothetical protein